MQQFFFRVFTNWIERYLTLRTDAPDVLEKMRGRADEFELIPVPAELVEQLLAERRSAEFVGFTPWGGFGVGKPKGGGSSAIIGVWDPVALAREFTAVRPPARDSVAVIEVAKHSEELHGLVAELGRCLERGDTDALIELVADDYLDLEQRDKSQLREALQRLFGACSDLRVILTKPEQLDLVGERMVSVFGGAWEARFAGPEGSDLRNDAFRLELIFDRDSDGRWKISSARYL